MNYFRKTMQSPIGPLHLVAADDALCGILYTLPARYADAAEADTPVLREAEEQLNAYFAGTRRSFDLPLAPAGTEFQRAVWKALEGIPFGTTRTYKEQAIAIARPTATRAVGRTNGLNPLSIVVPCHRVIGSSGALTGYAGGLAAKAFLLKLETGL